MLRLLTSILGPRAIGFLTGPVGILIGATALIIGGGVGGIYVANQFCKAEKLLAVQSALEDYIDATAQDREMVESYLATEVELATLERENARTVVRYVSQPASTDCTTDPSWVRVVNAIAAGKSAVTTEPDAEDAREAPAD